LYRKGETLAPGELRQLASIGNELTYTVMPPDSARRMAVDRDEDGYFDRDELDIGSDPANALSLETNRPPLLAAVTDRTIFGGKTLELAVSATDPDIPVQQLRFALSNAPPGT